MSSKGSNLMDNLRIPVWLLALLGLTFLVIVLERCTGLRFQSGFGDMSGT